MIDVPCCDGAEVKRRIDSSTCEPGGVVYGDGHLAGDIGKRSLPTSICSAVGIPDGVGGISPKDMQGLIGCCAAGNIYEGWSATATIL